MNRLTAEQLASIQTDIKSLLAASPSEASVLTLRYDAQTQTVAPGVKGITATINKRSGFYRIQVSHSSDGTLEETVPGLIADLP